MTRFVCNQHGAVPYTEVEKIRFGTSGKQWDIGEDGEATTLVEEWDADMTDYYRHKECWTILTVFKDDE